MNIHLEKKMVKNIKKSCEAPKKNKFLTVYTKILEATVVN